MLEGSGVGGPLRGPAGDDEAKVGGWLGWVPQKQMLRQDSRTVCVGGESRGEEVGSTRGGLGDTIDTFKDYPAWREGKLGGLQLSVSLPGAPWALTRTAPGGPQRAQGAKCSGTHHAPGWRDRERRCSSAQGPGPCCRSSRCESRSRDGSLSWRRREAEILASLGSASWLPPKCEIAQAQGMGRLWSLGQEPVSRAQQWGSGSSRG